VILVVLMLVLMFTGLGIMSMRHTRLELRSTGAYLDATQAAAMAEGALAIVATDIRLASDYYQFSFTQADHVGATTTSQVEEYVIPLSDEIYPDGAPADGSVPHLSEVLASDPDMQDFYGTRARTRVRHTSPLVGPCPPEYSCDDEQNYAWYYFLVNATADYGPLVNVSPSRPLYESGRARARGRVLVGPIAAYGR